MNGQLFQEQDKLTYHLLEFREFQVNIEIIQNAPSQVGDIVHLGIGFSVHSKTHVVEHEQAHQNEQHKEAKEQHQQCPGGKMTWQCAKGVLLALKGLVVQHHLVSFRQEHSVKCKSVFG